MTERRLFASLIGALVAGAWLALFLWGRSPSGRLLSHEGLEEVDLGASYVTVLLVFVVGWTLMTIAMMLPTSLPLVYMFRVMTRSRTDGGRLVSLLVLGYLAVWMLFGVLAHAGDLMVHEVVERNAWLRTNAWMIGAVTLIVAGAYQFTSLKYKCLDKCRSPLMFIARHWSGGAERLQALRLGFGHGLFCVGCCWSLMLLMFAVGVGNLAWMLLLAVVMAIEKNMPWGRLISRPLGSALLASGALTLLVGLV